METIRAVDDEFLKKSIDGARSRVVYVAPGLGKAVAEALIGVISRGRLSVTVVLDSDEDAYRIGYGEPEALALLHAAVKSTGFPLRRQAGLRIGLLVCDEELVIWAPTARSVESERTQEQPNAIVLTGSAVQNVVAAAGTGDSEALANHAEIGRELLPPRELQDMIESLTANPPAPFDLAQKTRVFSTRLQFVEFEVQGAEWTGRRIKLSSLLLNADLPQELQDILDTQVRPFQGASKLAFEVPHLVNGKPAFEHDGKRMMVSETQAGITSAWSGIRDRYLHQLKGFGWLIRRDRLGQFRSEVEAYEEILVAWVSAFRDHVEKDEDQLVKAIVESIKGRLERSSRRGQLKDVDLKTEVERGLRRLRVIEPRVRIVLKNVSWESSRDEEFMSALRQAVPKEDLAGWFEEFTAARQRPGDST